MAGNNPERRNQPIFTAETWQTISQSGVPQSERLDLIKTVGIFIEAGCPQNEDNAEMESLLIHARVVPNEAGLHDLARLMQFHNWNVRQFERSMKKIIREHQREHASSPLARIDDFFAVSNPRHLINTKKLHLIVPDLSERVDAIISSR